MAYLIQGETLTAIANQTRRLTGTSGTLSPAQMATALGGVSPGGGSYDNNSNVFSFSVGSGSLDAGDYINSNKSGELTAISMPACTGISGWLLHGSSIVSAYFPSCMSVAHEAFSDCSALETVTLNSACDIAELAFGNVLAPEDKIFRLYLRGNSMGTCEDNAFNLWEDTSSSSASPYDSELGAIPGLEIYVPASLLNDFKTTWAGGAFAGNIYPLTD